MKVTRVLFAVLIYIIAVGLITGVTWFRNAPTDSETTIACVGIGALTVLTISLLTWLGYDAERDK